MTKDRFSLLESMEFDRFKCKGSPQNNFTWSFPGNQINFTVLQIHSDTLLMVYHQYKRRLTKITILQVANLP